MISSLSQFTQNAFAEPNHQDDEDVEATLHSTLISNSGEIHSNLMPIGTYSFFETPQLDIGSFSHDLTKIDVKSLQYPLFNSTSSQDYSFVDGINATEGNHTIYFNQEIPEYATSGGFDTIIYLNFNYSSPDYQTYTILHENFTSYGNWSLYDVNESYIVYSGNDGDTHVRNDYPGNNYGSLDKVRTFRGGNEPVQLKYYSYIKYEYPTIPAYLELNQTDSTFTCWSGVDNDPPTNLVVYNTSNFDENTITWNTKPARNEITQYPLYDGGWTIYSLGSTRYEYYSFWFSGVNGNNFFEFRSKEYGGGSHVPYISHYFAKNYQNDSIIYMQTNETETLSLMSPDYGDIKLVNKDNITIQCQSTSDHQLNLELLNDDSIVKTVEVIPDVNTNFNNQTIVITLDEDITFDRMKFTGVFDDEEYFKCYDINITGFKRENFETVYIEDFSYTVLGTPYNHSTELNLDEDNSDYYGRNEGIYRFYFDSTTFSDRDPDDDLIINNQNSTIIIDLLEDLNMTLDFTVNISYSTNTWKVPTEVSLTINSQSVIDSTYNSGYVYLSTFPTTLSITADSNVFFELNITSYFTFTFDLEIISKTYLRKTFKLLSDHSIYIETIALDSDLDIKKIYLNNDDLGNSNPNHLSPSVQMDTDNIFNLEIILAEVLYRNLPYDTSRELYDEDWSSWNLGYDSDDTISSYNDGNLSSQLQAGHYPGTYSFKDEAGKTGTDISFVYSRTADCEIIYELGEHRKVLNISASGWQHARNLDPNHEQGIVEFWIRLEENNQNHYVEFRYDPSNRFIVAWRTDGYLAYYDGSFHNIENYSANVWYHVKVEFDVNDDWHLWVDGVSKDNGIGYGYQGNPSYISYLHIYNEDGTSYFDAIGFSWDPNYAIGDNYYFQYFKGTHPFEKYNLSTYENNYGTYDFEDYSLYDTYGNYTAEHGFDLETEAGFYKGSAGFNYESDGETSPDWIDVNNNDADCTATIRATVLDDHKNYLELDDQNAVGNCHIEHNFGVAQADRVFEFWWTKDNISDDYRFRFMMYEGASMLVSVYMTYDDIKYWDGASKNVKLNCITVGTFIHVKIILDDSTNTYDIYVDGTLEVDNAVYADNSTTGATKCVFSTYSTHTRYKCYLDAPGLVDEIDPKGYTYVAGYDINPFNIDKFLDALWRPYPCLINTHMRINPSVGSHENVLEIYDNNTGSPLIYKYFTQAESGTIEFWMRSSDVSKGSFFDIRGENGRIVQIDLNDNKIRVYNGTTNNLCSASSDTWYHVKIEFDCSTNPDTFTIYVNGTDYGTYNGQIDSTAFNRIRIYTGTTHTDYYLYVDALDISWSDDYVSYRNSNPYGQLTELEDDGWELSYRPYTSISVIYDNSPHNKILNLTDNSGSNNANSEIYFNSQTSGTIEFWHYVSNVDGISTFKTEYLGWGLCMYLFLYLDGKFKYMDLGGSYIDTGITSNIDVWQHHKIVFDCDTDTFDWYVDGVLIVDDAEFRYVRDSVASCSFATYSVSANYSIYIDSLAFSWDPDYSVAQNTNPYYEDLRDTGFVDDFDVSYAYNCWVNISGEYGQHKKYVELYDNSNENYVDVVNNFANQEYGTIEFFIRSSDTTFKNTLWVRDGGSSLFGFQMDLDKFQVYDGAWNDVGLGASNDTWYHVRIAFECTGGGYESLAQYDWKIWINGTEYGDYDMWNNRAHADDTSFRTNSADNGYKLDIDALSFSWEDPIGINLLKEVSEIDNPYTTTNKTISGADLELYSYTVIISFTYKFTQYGAYLNTTKMNGVELIDDNTYHIYSTTITTSQHSFFYTFNISNGILLLSDFNFVIENQHSIQKTTNPITSVNSVEFKEYLESDRTFQYWYYRNVYTINSLEIEHDSSSIITSSFGYENHKYYFSQYANTDDEFTGTIDYNPNWQISFTFIINNATYSKVKVDYGADFVIYNTTLVMDLRNSGIFDDIENPNRDNYVLNIDSLSFSSTTQSLYIIGNRTQQTPNPQTDVDLVQLNEEFTYNSQVLSSSYVSVNPNWQISTSVIDKNGTYGKLEIDYKADLPLINVDLKTLVKRNNMFSDVVETKDYQNDTSIYFQLDGLSFTTDYQSTYVEGFRTLLELDITTDDIYLDYNEEYKWSSTSLSNYTVGLCPCWLVSISVLENNGTYGKVQVDFKADLSLINVDLKFSILRNVIFGDSIEIKGYQNTTEINFILENINFTTSLQSEVVEGFRTLLESDITTDDIYLDYNEEYKWSSISLSNYSIEIKPNWDVSFSYVYNNASYSYIQSDYSSDLDFYNVTMNLDLRNTAIFDDMDNQGKDDYLLTIEYLNFTTSTKTLYITGTRTQYTSNPQTDINIIQLNETIIYNNDVLTTSLVDNDPNWQISISVIQKNATYGKLEIEYKSDATYTNVDLKTSITRNNMFDDSVEVKGYQNETTLSFELSVITFNSSFQITYIEGFRYLDEIDIHTNMSYVDYEERYYWSSVSLNNYSIEINPNWVILSSIVEYNGTYSKIKIQCKSDIAINNVTLQFSRSRNSIFGDIYELAGYQNITKIEFNLQNVNFTSLYQTTYIECFRSLTQINPNTNMTYLDFEEQYYWNSTSLSNHSIRINPNWNVGYSIISNNGTFAQLNISYYSDLFISDILLKLSLRYDDLYAENWSNNAQQSIYTYILEIPDINFTTSEQILNLTGVSSVPYCNFSSFINEDGFKLSDEEWRIKITDEEWRTITKSNWEDIEVYMYGYVQFTKYSRVFIISDMEDDWELDGVHYQGIPYDISATGYFTCEGWGSGITSAYLRFKTNPIEDLRREQTREQVIYKIKSKYDLEDVDFIFYIEEDERYNINDMIKQLKKEIDCTDIIKYYSVEDRDYYMIMDMDLDEGTNKITIYYKIENAAKYSWAFLIVGIAMIGFSIIYISYRYYDNKILDFIGLDKLVKYFFWIKKSERIKMTKKYRLNKKKKKRGKK